MSRYKHYSFDLWMTLIRSNPDYRPERSKFFYTHFNAAKKTVEEINAIFRRIDLMANAINEKTGNHIDAEELYLMVLSEMNDGDHSRWKDLDMSWLMSEMDSLTFRHPPAFYSEETPDVLYRLKQDNPGISLLSNTAFIKGKVLRKVLDDLGLAGYFDFQLYSDEEGWAKPNVRLFRRMLDRVKDRRAETGLEEIGPSQIVHIGDNETADAAGARALGIGSLLINSNDKSISSLFE